MQLADGQAFFLAGDAKDAAYLMKKLDEKAPKRVLEAKYGKNAASPLDKNEQIADC